jgi:NAD(P)-dependent dehydrogenase (short-subunit alcohol dehydrogenase family)
MTLSLKLDGEVALVTGASSGIGRFAAGLLARCGAHVALTARRMDRLEALASEIAAEGGKARAFALDVTDTSAIEPVVASIERDLGPISILINNAGIYLLKDALSATADEIDRLHAVNVRGAFLVAQAVGRRMIAAKVAGRIVNLGSIAGLRPMPQLGVYGMSKAAVIHMTKALAREWGRYGINVCAVSPGYFHTEMTENDLRSDAAPKLIERLPRRRIGNVEDLETALLFLVAPGSRLVNGAIVPVDDGLSIA